MADAPTSPSPFSPSVATKIEVNRKRYAVERASRVEKDLGLGKKRKKEREWQTATKASEARSVTRKGRKRGGEGRGEREKSRKIG